MQMYLKTTSQFLQKKYKWLNEIIFHMFSQQQNQF